MSLIKKSNVQNLHIANSDKLTKLYNLDVIISVGYRIKSFLRDEILELIEGEKPSILHRKKISDRI